jgi:hypothetical protein
MIWNVGGFLPEHFVTENGAIPLITESSGKPRKYCQTRQKRNIGLQVFTIGFLLGCCPLPAKASSTPASATSWQATETTQIPKNEIPSIYANPYRQPIATLAWEDGVYITRDGLALYTDYFPADVLTALLNGAVPYYTYLYSRGPNLGQDFSNPFSGALPWYHSDIAYATRASVTQPFSGWSLTQLRGTYFNRGAPQGIDSLQGNGGFDYFVYTADGTSHITIMLLRNTDRSLSGTAMELPANVDDPRYNEDNPHIERYDDTDPNKLVLFFDSDNWPGVGGHDIWYAVSSDGGVSWSNPKSVKSINTKLDEEQPHLYFDGSQWWLFFTATNPTDGRLAIYRARQGIAKNWDSWVNEQLVVSPGSTLGVGEPTLTAKGDLSFVAVIHNQNGTPTDQWDCDPWFMPSLGYH